MSNILNYIKGNYNKDSSVFKVTAAIIGLGIIFISVYLVSGTYLNKIEVEITDGGYVTGAGTYENGENVTLKAEAKEGVNAILKVYQLEPFR
ncbi:hypothetical protein PRVXH_002145 [Proteinivorax hydrogeniformans]|uniref:Uncharacterized protein n=1 Tax=Proteinivorax hydrogeniformans TaxID=1826727 RepID=A0AAU8HRK2_9FIRM